MNTDSPEETVNSSGVVQGTQLINQDEEDGYNEIELDSIDE